MTNENQVASAELPPGFFNLVPQGAIRQASFPAGKLHNSIWDMIVMRGGRIFVSLCAELNVSATAEVYEFDIATNAVRFCFDLRPVTLCQDRAIPPSKVHTSMSELPDGRIFMATHSTAAAPGHATWLIDGYCEHLWEGYAGSNLLIFDPVSGQVQNLGVPVPRDSIYGGIYHPGTNRFYFMTWLRGHLYSYDLATARVKDYGQVTEFGSFRLVAGPDGNLYSSSRSGYLFQVNTKEDRVVHLGVEYPTDANRWSRMHRQTHHGVVGPDGRLYLSAIYNRNLFVYDPAANTLESVGVFSPEDAHPHRFTRSIYGIDFDSHGVLWYGQSTNSGYDHIACHLIRWDILRGGNPVNCGIIGTPERGAVTISELHIVKDMLVATDTNHGEDQPVVVTIDLRKLEASLAGEHEICRDARVYYQLSDGDERYPGGDFDEKKHAYDIALENLRRHGGFTSKVPFYVKAESFDVHRLWKTRPPGKCAVDRLQWKSEDELLAEIAGSGEVVSISDKGMSSLGHSAGDSIPAKIRHSHGVNSLPGRAGRQHLSRVTASCEWNGGRSLVGNEDGMLAIIGDSTCFHLGPVAAHGPIHDLATDATGRIAYGVAGDPKDVGQVFRYDDENGLLLLGRIFANSSEEPPISAGSTEPVAIAVSPSGTKVAIGVADRLGCIYVFTNIDASFATGQGIPKTLQFQ